MFRPPPTITTATTNPIPGDMSLPRPSSAHVVAPSPALPYAPTSMGFITSEQMAAIQVAAMASAASFAASASAISHPFAHSNLIHHASLASSLASTMQHQTIAPKSSLEMPSLQHEAADSASTAESIRRDQVEAALKSKPQRGRKREDLSELERLELTRTRNREHAKSTRIRKKARHQELLDIEKRHEDFENKIMLTSKRRTVISEFFKNVEVTLHNFQATYRSESSGEDTPSVGNATRSLPSWADLVESTAKFQFVDGLEDNCENYYLSGLERMRRFGDYIYSGILSKFGDSTLMRLLRYQIKGNENGIALDSVDGGLVEVELLLDLPTKMTLMAGVWRFRFGLESEKIQSVSLIQTTNAFTSSYPDRLGGQISHPSTVSLDPILQGYDCFKGVENKHDPESAGPGMSI